MKSITKINIAIWVIILTIALATLMFHLIQKYEFDVVVSNMTYKSAIADFDNYKFGNRNSRYLLEAIAAYKIKSMKQTDTTIENFNIPTMTDYAIFMIASSNILDTSSCMLSRYNNQEFIDIVSNYNKSTHMFKDNAMREKAFKVLKMNANQNSLSDDVIYASLLDIAKCTF